MEIIQFVLFSFTCKIRAPRPPPTLSLLEFPTPRKLMEEQALLMLSRVSSGSTKVDQLYLH